MKSRKKIITTSALLMLSLAWQLPLAAMESSWLIDGTASMLLGRNPDLKIEGTETGGVNLTTYINPILAWKRGSWVFSPSLNLDYSGAATPLQVDEERFLFSSQMSAAFEFGGTWKPSRDSRISLFATSDTFRGKVTKDEEWGKGLYDANESGGYFDWVQKWDTSTPTKSTVGIQFSSIRYPNFLSSYPTEPQEVPTKDSDNVKFYLRYEIAWNTDFLFLTNIDYSVTSSKYTHFRITDENGTLLTDDGSKTALREDTIHNLGIALPMEFGKHEFNVIYDAEVRASNANFFDLQADVNFPEFRNYLEHAFTLGYGYELPKAWIFKAPHLNLQLTGLTRFYPGRLAEDESGNYKNIQQRDNQAQFNLGLSSPLSDHWGLFFNSNTVTYSSNNDDQGSAIFNYEFVTVALGAQFFY